MDSSTLEIVLLGTEVVSTFDGLLTAHVPCPAWTSEHLRILGLTAPRQQDA